MLSDPAIVRPITPRLYTSSDRTAAYHDGSPGGDDVEQDV
jgi:hypothetical protein